jgi:hypothetical protein
MAKAFFLAFAEKNYHTTLIQGKEKMSLLARCCEEAHFP